MYFVLSIKLTEIWYIDVGLFSQAPVCKAGGSRAVDVPLSFKRSPFLCSITNCITNWN